MGDITKPQTSAMSAEAFAAGGQKFKDAGPKVSEGGVPFLKMDTEDGEWAFGQEDTAVPADALFGIFPQSFASGFAAWKGKTLEAKQMAVYGQPAIDPRELPPVASKDGWQPAVGLALVCVECPSDEKLVGTLMLFEQTSHGGIEAWNKIFDAILARAKGGHADFAALVKLGSTSYMHKTWGRVFKPRFEPDGWDTPDALITDFGAPPAISNKSADDDESSEGKAVEPESRRSRRGGDSARDVTPKGEVEDAEVVSETPSRRRRRG